MVSSSGGEDYAAPPISGPPASTLNPSTPAPTYPSYLPTDPNAWATGLTAEMLMPTTPTTGRGAAGMGGRPRGSMGIGQGGGREQLALLVADEVAKAEAAKAATTFGTPQGSPINPNYVEKGRSASAR